MKTMILEGLNKRLYASSPSTTESKRKCLPVQVMAYNAASILEKHDHLELERSGPICQKTYDLLSTIQHMRGHLTMVHCTAKMEYQAQTKLFVIDNHLTAHLKSRHFVLVTNKTMKAMQINCGLCMSVLIKSDNKIHYVKEQREGIPAH